MQKFSNQQSKYVEMNVYANDYCMCANDRMSQGLCHNKFYFDGT